MTITYKYDVVLYVSIARPCFGAHHFLHQKSNAILAVRRTPIGGTCLFDRNLAGLGVRPASGRRGGRSCPYSLWTDPGELTPFQGGTVYWTIGRFPGLKPRAESS